VDTLFNPYTPGAGSRPRELAGRDAQLQQFDNLLGRLERGNHERSIVISGLRGVGKTVLLNEFEDRADDRDWAVSALEVESTTDFRFQIAEMVRGALLDLSPRARRKDKLVKAARLLKGFTLTPTAEGEVSGGFDIDAALAQPATASIERQLVNLFVGLGEVARDAALGAVFFIDEMQLLAREDLEALIAAIHRTGQKNLPVAVVGAGLPILRGLLVEAKSYAERLFAYPELGPLPDEAAARALTGPARSAIPDAPVEWHDDALAEVTTVSEGYPYFLQAYGKFAWELAEGAAIALDDVERAKPLALAELDREFFEQRYERATPAERWYLAAIAELGDGPQPTAKVVKAGNYRSTSASSPVRQSLLDKGLVYAPAHGLIDFTVPHFADFMRRRHPLRGLERPKRRRAPR
jgi:hypothetical protein